MLPTRLVDYFGVMVSAEVSGGVDEDGNPLPDDGGSGEGSGEDWHAYDSEDDGTGGVARRRHLHRRIGRLQYR